MSMIYRNLKKTPAIVKWSIFFLVLYSQWGFVLTKTVFKNNFLVYVVFVSFLISFLIISAKLNFKSSSRLSYVWLPYLILTILACLIRLNLENLTYLFIWLVLLFLPVKYDYFKIIPRKVIFYSGIVAFAGIMIQMFFSDFYNSKISKLFINDDIIEAWSEGYGYAGFTFQVGKTATILIAGLATLISFKKDILPPKLKSNVFYYLLLILLIWAVFLTGKRMISIIAIVLPFIVSLLSSSNNVKKINYLLGALLFTIAFSSYFVENLNQLSDSYIMHRFVKTYQDYNTGEDVTTGRLYLYSLAWELFVGSPIFGVGYGNFRSLTGSETEVHNTFLQVLCEQGIFGFVLYVIPMLYCIIHTINLKKRFSNTSYIPFLKFSIAIQIFCIFYAFTGNINGGFGLALYFIALGSAIRLENILLQQKGLIPQNSDKIIKTLSK